MQFQLVTKFDGSDAHYHRLPAYEGAQSLEGISRSLQLVSHYVATDTIRKQKPFSEQARVYISAHQPGSFETIYSIVTENLDQICLAGGTIALGVTANFLTEMIKTIFSRVVGQSYQSPNGNVGKLEEERPGDFEALVDAVEPAMIRAHSVINHGATTITIINGDNNVVTFNGTTKEYVNRSEQSDEEEMMDVSVGSFNVNTGYGRIFDHSIGKTIPFKVHRECDTGTYAALSNSLNDYAHGRPSDVQIRFRRTTAPDGRTKKLMIYGACKPSEETEM